jgi:hypothetical protein
MPMVSQNRSTILPRLVAVDFKSNFGRLRQTPFLTRTHPRTNALAHAHTPKHT